MIVSFIGRKIATCEFSGICFRLALLLLFFVTQPPAFGQQDYPDLVIEAKIDGDDGVAPKKISGRLTISNWVPDSSLERCFALSYNDSNYGDDRGKRSRLQLFGTNSQNVVFSGGETLVQVTPPATVALSSVTRILRLNVPAGFTDPLSLNFESTIPRQAGESSNEYFYEGWYPQPLANCPNEEEELEDSPYFRQGATVKISAQIHYPRIWDFIGPAANEAKNGTATITLLANNAPFILGRGYKKNTTVLSGVPLRLYTRSGDMKALLPTLEASLAIQESLFGNFPFEGLTVVETSELQRHGLPGLIAINTPRQTVFSRVQSDWINWRHWMITSLVASQWYGAFIHASPDDYWLIEGIVDFASFETLRQLPNRYNLFNPVHNAYRLVSFDYLQMSNITAAMLRKNYPFATLTNSLFQTAMPAREQSSFLFIKQANALRQMRSFAGDTGFSSFLQSVTAAYANKSLTPQGFRLALSSPLSPFTTEKKLVLRDFLNNWWTTNGWPDFKLEEFDIAKIGEKKWLSHVTAKQEGEIDFPPMLTVREKTGKKFSLRSQKMTGHQEVGWSADFLTDFKPTEALVDAENESFDSNRFNNSSQWADINFFPGSANTLKDDAYTVVWLPYAFRRPGEPFSFGIQGGLFQYLQSGLLFKAEYAPSEHDAAFEIRQRFQTPQYALLTDFTFEQTYDDDRQIESAFTRTPLFGGEPFVSLGLKLRGKQRMGVPVSRHATYATSLTIRPAVSSSACGYNVSAEVEHAPRELAKHFTYVRKYGSLLGACSYQRQINLSLRFFSGAVYTEGIVPEAALFKPNDLKEARLRLDKKGLGRVKQLSTINTDLLVPFFAPISEESLILVRKVRWRLFYDYGRADLEKRTYRSSGVGFLLPFGGDLSGAGSLTISQFTLLAVLYSNVDGDVSKKPSIIFDVTGEL